MDPISDKSNTSTNCQNFRNATIPNALSTGVPIVDGVAFDIGYRVDEIKALADACRADEGGAGIRDAALIGILYTCGLLA
jgi:hypothetical protein